MRAAMSTDIVWFTMVGNAEEEMVPLAIVIPKGAAQAIRESISFIQAQVIVQAVVVSLTRKWSKEPWFMFLEDVKEVDQEEHEGLTARVLSEPPGHVSFELTYATSYNHEVMYRRTYATDSERFPLDLDGGIFVSDTFEEKLLEGSDAARKIREKLGEELFEKILTAIKVTEEELWPE